MVVGVPKVQQGGNAGSDFFGTEVGDGHVAHVVAYRAVAEDREGVVGAQDALFDRLGRLIPAVQGLDALDLLWQPIKAQPNPRVLKQGVEFNGLKLAPSA